MATGKGGKSDPAKIGSKGKLPTTNRKVFKISQAKGIIRQITRMRVSNTAAKALNDAVTYLLTEILDGANDMAVHEQKKKLQPRHIKMSITKDHELYYVGGEWLIKSGGATGFLRNEEENKKEKTVK